MVENVIETGVRNLAKLYIQTADDVRQAGQKIIGFSGSLLERESGLKNFMFNNLYWHKTVLGKMNAGQAVITDLFGAYLKQPELTGFVQKEDENTPLERHIADYIAGMTDRFALKEHRRLFDHTPDMG